MPDKDRATFDDLRNAPTSLPASSVVYTSDQVSKLLEEFSRVTEANNYLEDETRKLKRRIQTTEILDQLIEPYAKRTYWFMVGYCTFVGIIVYMSGLENSGFKTSDDVLRILVGSTAVTVIGLVGMILTGVFVGARKP